MHNNAIINTNTCIKKIKIKHLYLDYYYINLKQRLLHSISNMQ